MNTVRFMICIFAIFFFNSTFAQDEVGNGLLLPKFENGTVVFKNGSRSSALLNYDIVQQEMLFINADSMALAISNPQDIIVVIIGERRFLPVSSEGIFYEEIPAGTGSFFVHRKASMISKGKAAAYGGYSSTSSTTTLGAYHDSSSGVSFKMKQNEQFNLTKSVTYYLKSGNSYKRFNSAKSLGKLFKGRESEILKFANEQSVNFSKIDDIKQIVEYGYSLMNK